MSVEWLLLALLMGAESQGAGGRITGASSHLEEETRVMEWSGEKPRWRAATFEPSAAMDGSLATAWCEGAPGRGKGEWIEVELDRLTRVVEIVGGFRKLSLVGPGVDDRIDAEETKGWFERSLRTFKDNGRPAVLELTTEKGKVLERFRPGDRYFGRYAFAVRLEPGRYRLRIAEVYPGTRYEDTCIAEIRFGGPKEKAPPAGLPSALRSLTERWACRASPAPTVLPRELVFLTATVNSFIGGASSARIETAVRGPEGWLLPTTDVSCFWGATSKDLECIWSGEETEEESLGEDASLDLPAWSGVLRTSPQLEGGRQWKGEQRSPGTAPLELKVVFDPASEGMGPFVVSATREGTVVETARYACAPAP